LPLKPLHQLKPKRLPGRGALTVCIGAIAENKRVIGVSDRMLTAADGQIEFETGQVKAWLFSNSIIALVAGDTTIQAEILRQVDKEVKAWIDADKATWVNVKDVASMYCKKYREIRRARAEAEILYPLGLDIQSFLANNGSMQNELVAKISQQLTEYEFPTVQETIFLGMDNDGPRGPDGIKYNYPQLYVTM
jgi:hypothetical protein